MSSRNYRTLAKLVSDFQRPFASLAEAVERDGIHPAMVLNGIAYFDGDGVERINRALTPNLSAAASGELLELVGEPATITAAADSGGKVRRFSMNAYNGGAMMLKAFRDAPCVVDLAGVSGADKSRPIFLNHSETAIVGHTDSISVNPTGALAGIHATGIVSGAGPAAKEVLDSHDKGFPWQASIGARPDKVEFVRKGESVIVNGRQFDGPIHVARKTMLGEISFVPIGADQSTSVAIAATHSRNRKMETTATLDNNTTTDGETLILQERQRVAGIGKLASQYRSKMPPEKLEKIEAAALDSGWNPERTELEMIRGARPDAHIHTAAASNAPDHSEMLTAAMCMTAGMSEDFIGKQFDERTMDAAVSKPMRGAGIHEAIRFTLRAAGRHVPDRIDDQAIRAAFDADNWLRAEGFSTMSLPGILANVQNKSLLQAYQSVATTWQLFCAQSDVKDFKPALRLRLVGSGQFAPIQPTGEIHNMSLQDQQFTNTVGTQGALIVITRQMLINDDTAALQMVPKILGRASAVALEKAVFTALLGNAASFFGTGNNNYLSGGPSALSIDSLTSAESKFLKMTDPNGDPILVAPKTLLVPAELSTTASALTRSTEIRDTTSATKYPTINPHAGRFVAAATPWLSGTLTNHSATGWYMFSDPADIAAVDVAFLSARAPTIQTFETHPGTLGILTRAYFDFGVALQDPRGGVFSAGA